MMDKFLRGRPLGGLNKVQKRTNKVWQSLINIGGAFLPPLSLHGYRVFAFGNTPKGAMRYTWITGFGSGL